jgi:hypothetical protein
MAVRPTLDYDELIPVMYKCSHSPLGIVGEKFHTIVSAALYHSAFVFLQDGGAP